MKSKVPHISLFLLLAGFWFPQAIIAQSGKRGWESYAYVQGSNPWLQSCNAAGIYSIPIGSLSFAEAYIHRKGGKLRNYFESDNSVEYGANVRSLYRLNPKTVFYGNVHYSRFEGKNMGGATFIDPYASPFNIVEYADSTQGKKALDRYRLAGAFSAKLSGRLHVGAKLDYKASNYAKFKDLRHENKELDMLISLGAIYRVFPFLETGINYLYRRRIEEIRFQSYGNKDQQFNSLIDFGAFYGHQVRFGESDGYTQANFRKPLFEKYQGASLQLHATLSPQLLFFNELTLKWKDGYFGEQGTSSIVYTAHDAKIYAYKGNLSFQNKNDRHILSFNTGRELLRNYENSFQKNTLPNGSTVIEYSSREQMSEKTLLKFGAGYTAYLGVKDYLPAWIFGVKTAVCDMKRTVSLYPGYRKQDINQWEVGVSAGRNVIRSLNQYSFTLGFCYTDGGGYAKKDGTYNSSQGQTSAVSLDRYIYREFEYFTTGRIGGNAGFRYSRLLASKMKGYAQIDYALTNAFSTRYIGKTFHECSLSVGIGF